MKIYAYIAAGLAVMAFIVWYSSNQFDAGYNTAKAEYESVMRARLNVRIAESEKKQVRMNDITAKWLAEKDNIKIEYVKIKEKVTEYVEDNRSCDLNRGAVGLLNKSAKGKRMHQGGDSTITETEAKQPSTITQQAQINHCIGWAEQYNEIAERYTTLIDVLEEAGL